MIGGIDAFIKVSQGWPLADSPLKLVSLKSSDHYTKGASLSLVCKVEVRWIFLVFVHCLCLSLIPKKGFGKSNYFYFFIFIFYGYH